MSARSGGAATGRIHDAIPGLDRVTAALAEGGERSCLVGPALLRALAGERVPAATLWTEAPGATIAERLPRGVPVEPNERAWRIANGGQPIFVRPVAAPIEAALARMPFGVLAVGLDGEAEAWCDPVDGLADLEAGRLGLRGTAEEAGARDPLLVLRAASLVADHGLACDAAQARALAPAVPALDHAPAAHLAALLLGAFDATTAGPALALLDAAGLRAAWLGAGSSVDAAGIDALPRDLALRLLAWCRPHPVARLLRRVRLGAGLRGRLVGLAEHHPLDERHPSPRPRAVRRLLDRIGDGGFDGLVAMRRAELAAEPHTDARARLDALAGTRTALARAAEERIELAIGGRALIDTLGLAPGPAIGRLLDRLETEVAAGRVANEGDRLLDRAAEIHAQGD